MYNSHEFRVSYDEAATLISAVQQGGWYDAYGVYEEMVDAGLDLDF